MVGHRRGWGATLFYVKDQWSENWNLRTIDSTLLTSLEGILRVLLKGKGGWLGLKLAIGMNKIEIASQQGSYCMG